MHNLAMAKNTIVEITDDIDGSKNAQEVTFSFQGVNYTVDLAKKNLTTFEKALQPYIDVATKVPGSRVATKRAGAAQRQDLAAIRAWAQENGIKIAPRGRISRDVMARYEATK